MDNKISFTSKINFITYDNFLKLKYKENPTEIDFPVFGKGHLFENSKKFCTYGVRTCTAGGFTDRFENSLGFHILDCEKNYKKMDKICELMLKNFKSKPESALLVGFKDIAYRPYSLPIFNFIERFLEENNIKLSFFKQHKLQNGETHLMYDLKNDTWNLCTKLFDPWTERYYSVENTLQLKKCYKYISISDKDRLFINGQEVHL